ncbi:MAG: hypothetical protein JWQ09_2327 [Segetibacter sp.]|nr:hypothetical protein [Segetibacter sp.]
MIKFRKYIFWPLLAGIMLIFISLLIKKYFEDKSGNRKVGCI